MARVVGRVEKVAHDPQARHQNGQAVAGRTGLVAALGPDHDRGIPLFGDGADRLRRRRLPLASSLEVIDEFDQLFVIRAFADITHHDEDRRYDNLFRVWILVAGEVEDGKLPKIRIVEIADFLDKHADGLELHDVLLAVPWFLDSILLILAHF